MRAPARPGPFFGAGLVVLGLAAVLPARASGTAAASLQVSATVLPYARIESETHPPVVEVTEADVARGFIDVTGDASLEVRTNHTSYALEFRAEGPLQVIAVGLGGLGEDRMFGAVGRVRRAVPGPIVETLRPRWRFYFSDAVAPGSYPWPLKIDASAGNRHP